VFELAWPWLLVALPLPPLVAWLLPRAPGWIATALHLPHTGLMLEQQADVSPVPRLRSALALLAWALLVFAAARPQWLGAPEDVPRSGRDLMLAIDTSGSMSIEDMQLDNMPAPRFAAIQAIKPCFKVFHTALFCGGPTLIEILRQARTHAADILLGPDMFEIAGDCE